MIQIIECPRDAMQGMKSFVDTELKIDYLKSLLEVGFHTIDFTSFVSPKAIPQMADCHEVSEALKDTVKNLKTETKLLAIVANQRGAEDAAKYTHISYLGFPFSISETFQQRNTKQSIAQAEIVVADIQKIAIEANKKLVVYLSMGFGNPYGDEWSAQILEAYAQKMIDMGIEIISLADTLGNATANEIEYAFSNLIPKYPKTIFGAHFHATPEVQFEKIRAAQNAGCKRFDGAILGFGGCPFADDHLVGNINTCTLLDYFKDTKELNIYQPALQIAVEKATKIFLS